MNLKTEIKILLARANMSMTELNTLLNECRSNPTTVQNLNTRLTNGTLKYTEVEDILRILGYKITWERVSE